MEWSSARGSARSALCQAPPTSETVFCVKAFGRIPLIGAIEPYRGATWILELGPDAIRLFDEYGSESVRICSSVLDEACRLGRWRLGISSSSGAKFWFKSAPDLVPRITLYLAEVLHRQGPAAVELFRRKTMRELAMPAAILLGSLAVSIFLALFHGHSYVTLVAAAGVVYGLVKIDAALPALSRLRAADSRGNACQDLA